MVFHTIIHGKAGWEEQTAKVLAEYRLSLIHILKCGGILDRVGQNRGGDIPVPVQFPTDGKDSPIHHIRRSHHIRPCLNVRKSRFRN